MPRYRRVVAPECAHHITQRGNHRCVVFEDDRDRAVYLDMVRENAWLCGVSLLGYCLMPNHVHWIVIPREEESLAEAFGRTHGRYSAYFQAKRGTSGHLWQNRFYSCVLGAGHLERAMRYVEMNPVRSGMAERAEEYGWSSARAHLRGWDPRGMLDLARWEEIVPRGAWGEVLATAAEWEDWRELERATYAGKVFGDKEFRRKMEGLAGRDLSPRRRGRPPKVAVVKM